MSKRALVIGATGLLGYGVAKELNKAGWLVSAIGKEPVVSSNFFPEEIKYVCGDFYDDKFLANSLCGIDKVFFFLSTTFPHTSSNSLELEITRTLKGLDYLLRKMRDFNVPEIVYPSSGGTVYGNITNGIANETDSLNPTIPYGVGKKMSEEILRFYSSFGISSTVLRVGNVYGTPLSRNVSQGVIDVFVQKALEGETATIWGDALKNIRDYIFADDFSEAVAKIASFETAGFEVYNLSSGVGTSLGEIIQIINKYTDSPLKVNYACNDATSSIRRIILNMDKFKKKTAWIPRFDIDSGIAETIVRKKKMKEVL